MIGLGGASDPAVDRVPIGDTGVRIELGQEPAGLQVQVDKEVEGAIVGYSSEAFPDAVFSIDQYVFQGNAAAWKWSITGTHTQEIMGMAPPGRNVTISGLSAAVLKDGRIVQHWEFSDDQGLLAQLEAQTG